MVYHYYRLNMNLIYDKTYNFKEYSCENDITYSNSILNILDSINIKNDIDKIYKNINEFYYTFNKCSHIMLMMEKNCSHNSISNIDSITLYYRRMIYIYNIFNYVVKYKLYYEPKLNDTIKKTTTRLLNELNTDKCNTFNNKDTFKHRKMTAISIKLKEFLSKHILDII